ncbi:cutinase family protein [Nocardia carnea]|uniref:cutinase family protein n=1 Tax=Nocardia carnea TaxID=37328 RepID=UPI0024569AB3|nr:cutinase family protein [Nocardia carnea]
MAVSAPIRAAAAPAEADCPALFAIGVQVPGQAAADTGPTTDSGLLGEVFRPLVNSNDPRSFQRTYVRHQPVLGGVTTGPGPTPYEQGVQQAADELERVGADFLSRCPQSRLAVAGHGHGARVAAVFAESVGRNSGAVPADRVAAVALFSDPSRPTNSPTFPGAAAARSPSPAPGTAGSAIKGLPELGQQPSTGGGIDTQRRSKPAGFGRLSGRVASFCIAGDLACDTPENAPILKVVSNIASAADGANGDPLRALASVTEALAFTSIKAVTDVVNNDVQGKSLASVSLSSQTSLAARLAEASDPRTPLDINKVLQAVLKVGTIALNAVTTVVKAVVTPSNIAEIAAAGLANPVMGLAVLGQKLLGAIPQLIPPSTVSRVVNQAFQAVISNVTDNAGLIDTTTWVKYSDALTRRGAYSANPVAAGGQSPVQFTTAWLTALVHDLTAAAPAAQETSTRPTSSVGPTPSTPVSSAPPPSASSPAPATTSPASSSPPTR